MKTESERLDSARMGVLDSMEAGRKTLRFAIGAASLLEVALLARFMRMSLQYWATASRRSTCSSPASFWSRAG